MSEFSVLTEVEQNICPGVRLARIPNGAWFQRPRNFGTPYLLRKGVLQRPNLVM